MGDIRDEIVENASARFDGESEAGAMIQRYQQQIKEAQEQQIRNETSHDCE